MVWKSKNRKAILIGVSLAIGVVLLFVGPIPQDTGYHNFSDKRRMLGIPNFHNVISNFPFLILGIWGMLKFHGSQMRESLVLPFFIFCIGVILTSIGSSYYHLEPKNSTLLWDRLPMTVVFMSFFCAIVSDYIREKAGRRMLIPTLIAGLGSVLYWHFTEQSGSGDLRPYAVVQYLPGVLIPLILMMYDPASTKRRPVVMAFIFYFLLKLFEILDWTVYRLTAEIISGHALKHLFAAAGIYYVTKMFLESKTEVKAE
jgi:hypothetical protein